MINLHRLDNTEAVRIIECVSNYKALLTRQIIRLFPETKATIANMLINRYAKESRVYLSENREYIAVEKKYLDEPNYSMIKAFWVLLDLLDSGFHMNSDFPVLITLLQNNEVYEIIHIPESREAMIAYPLQKSGGTKRIIIIDDKEQIKGISIPDIIVFCTVDNDTGRPTYYKLDKEGK